MVIELLSRPTWGGLRFALEFMESKLGARPWCLVEVARASQASGASVPSAASPKVYLPALSPAFREAAACGRLLWVQPPEDMAPALIQLILESGLCEGSFVQGLETFSRASPAAIWGRRWQLAAQKGGSHLIWLHAHAQAVIGFDIRLEWTQPQSFEIKKGHGYFHDNRIEKKPESISASAGAA